MLRSLAIFGLAALCEIGGGYLVWLWLKEGKPAYYGLLGGIILAAYGVVATLQPTNFARTYATYGGIFIVASLLWAYKMEGYIPDRYDILGALVALTGVVIICYAPR
jgi:small multidrug resistance family-3 protein